MRSPIPLEGGEYCNVQRPKSGISKPTSGGHYGLNIYEQRVIRQNGIPVTRRLAISNLLLDKPRPDMSSVSALLANSLVVLTNLMHDEVAHLSLIIGEEFDLGVYDCKKKLRFRLRID